MMVPSPEMQLRSAMKSLTDSIRPAIDVTNKAAIEQIDLVVATLAMVRDRIPLVRRFARAELKGQIALAEALADVLRGGGAMGELTASATLLLSDPESDAAELERHAVELGNAVAHAISELPAEAAGALTKPMLAFSEAHSRRMQAWCLPAGYDSDVDGSLAIERLV